MIISVVAVKYGISKMCGFFIGPPCTFAAVPCYGCSTAAAAVCWTWYNHVLYCCSPPMPIPSTLQSYEVACYYAITSSPFLDKPAMPPQV